MILYTIATRWANGTQIGVFDSSENECEHEHEDHACWYRLEAYLYLRAPRPLFSLPAAGL